MKYLLFLVLGGGVLVFGLSLHRLAGAILLGLIALSLDLLWQWWRIRKFTTVGSARILTGIAGGFVVRLFSIVLLLKFSHSWLLPQFFAVFAAIVLALPVTGMVGAYFFGRRD